MVEQKRTWNQLSKKEKVVGTIGLGLMAVVGMSLVSGIVSAFQSAISTMSQQAASQETKPVEPVTTQKDVQTTEVILFEKVSQNDAARDVGTSAVTTPGANGVRTKTFRVTYADNKETARTLVGEAVTTTPVNEVTSIGTKQAYVPPAQTRRPSICDPNYSGCVPIASDVDCAGGSGNGPAYTGMVQVIGSDIYGLDRDGDGWACE